jgi:hypothetical protein
MSPLEGSRAPVESGRTQRNSFVHAAARKQHGVAPLVVLVALRSNYLESASGINEATASGHYISAPPAEISR